MTFRGWPAEALDFYEGLEADNSKTYWTAHKAVYDDLVRAPMDQLLAELEPEFGAGKVFRPYRDVRFSADKSPYKTHLGAWLEHGGYIQLSARGLGAGRGTLRTVPRGYPREHPRAALLRHKGVTAWREWPVAAWLGTATAKRRVVEFLRAAQPLTDWLHEHVGADSVSAGD